MWSSVLFCLSETSRHEKDNGPLHDQYDWERLESLPVKTLPTNRVGKINHITLIESTKKGQLLSYLSGRCQFTAPKLNVDVAPEKVSKKQYLIRSCFKRYVMFQGCKANLCLEVGTPSAFSRDKSSKRSQVIGCNKHQDLHSDRSWLQKIVAWWLMLTVS